MNGLQGKSPAEFCTRILTNLECRGKGQRDHHKVEVLVGSRLINLARSDIEARRFTLYALDPDGVGLNNLVFIRFLPLLYFQSNFRPNLLELYCEYTFKI